MTISVCGGAEDSVEEEPIAVGGSHDVFFGAIPKDGAELGKVECVSQVVRPTLLGRLGGVVGCGYAYGHCEEGAYEDEEGGQGEEEL